MATSRNSGIGRVSYKSNVGYHGSVGADKGRISRTSRKRGRK